MKRIYYLMIIGLSLIMVSPVQGQVLKKIGKRIEKSAERKFSDKTVQKAEQQIDKGLDGAFSAPGKMMEDAEDPKSSYKFAYHYQLSSNVPGQEEQIKMNYYLQPKSNYMGMAINQDGNNMFMVFDYKKEALYNFINNDGKKMVAALNLPSVKDDDDLDSWVDDESDADLDDFTVKDLPGKTILGYDCKGKQLENDTYIAKVYYTDAVPVSMYELFNTDTKGVDNRGTEIMMEEMKDLENAIMMEMEVENKQDASENMKMTCTKLEEVNRNFKTSDSDYESMF